MHIRVFKLVTGSERHSKLSTHPPRGYGANPAKAMKPETISHHCDDQGDQGEYAHSTRLATRILFKSFYVRSERSKDLCIHALASMSTLLSAFLHGKSATDLAIGVEDASSLSLRIVDRLSFSYVTVVMTDDEL